MPLIRGSLSCWRKVRNFPWIWRGRLSTTLARARPNWGNPLARANVVDNLPLQIHGKFLTFLQQLNEPLMSGISSRQESPCYQYTVTCGEICHVLRAQGCGDALDHYRTTSL